MMRLIAMAAGVLAATIALSGSAYSATTTYLLSNHPDAANNPPYDYGLRVDDLGAHFTFVNGGATLSFDDTALTAVIQGTINLSLGTTADDTDVGGQFSVFYQMSGVASDGNGGFTALGGEGFVSNGTDSYFFSGKQNGSGLASIFAFDGHRLAGDNSSAVFRGWIMDAVFTGLYDLGAVCQNGYSTYTKGNCYNDGYTRGTNDFLVTATPIPLPAGVWLFGTAVAGLGLMRRRRAQTA